jgi:hypothetical protein
MQGLRKDLTETITTLTSGGRSGLVTAIISGCELFLRFITLCELDNPVSQRINCGVLSDLALVVLNDLCCRA